jgi:hypothetical protein
MMILGEAFEVRSLRRVRAGAAPRPCANFNIGGSKIVLRPKTRRRSPGRPSGPVGIQSGGGGGRRFLRNLLETSIAFHLFGFRLVVKSRKFFVTFLVSFAISGCAQDVLPINCNDPDLQCYVDQAVKGIIIVRENISYWSNVHLIIQFLIVLCGIIATVMIALQGDENKHWTRPIGLVATALVTGLTSALVSFMSRTISTNWST